MYPSSILVLNDQDVLVDFHIGTMVFEMAKAIHGKGKHWDVDIRIGFIISTRDFLISAEQESEE